jgi:hypothetical protein
MPALRPRTKPISRSRVGLGDHWRYGKSQARVRTGRPSTLSRRAVPIARIGAEHFLMVSPVLQIGAAAALVVAPGRRGSRPARPLCDLLG